MAIACGFNGKGLTKFLDETEILDLITNNADNEENELISAIDIQRLFANMKIGQGLVDYVVGIVNDIYNE